ncbi:MAG: SDR family oxidoreductase, partial [Candidatus Rokubacteria bacterium]|nr:SDR family oxidoreductase [Candidatus Rokubacteria bacterium]
ITGAGRGIGLAFARHYVKRGERVFAGCRRREAPAALEALRRAHRDRLTIVPLDVADAASIHAAEALVHKEVDALDLLVNNAGIYSVAGSEEAGEKPGDLDFDDAIRVFRTNAMGPVMVAQACLGLLRRGEAPKIVSLSSEYGSVSANDGFPYYYAASKAALNTLMRSLAADARRWGITVALLDPGWVRTAMGGPGAHVTPRMSVDGMIRVIDRLTRKDSGRFLTFEGREQAW